MGKPGTIRTAILSFYGTAFHRETSEGGRCKNRGANSPLRAAMFRLRATIKLSYSRKGVPSNPAGEALVYLNSLQKFDRPRNSWHTPIAGLPIPNSRLDLSLGSPPVLSWGNPVVTCGVTHNSVIQMLTDATHKQPVRPTLQTTALTGRPMDCGSSSTWTA